MEDWMSRNTVDDVSQAINTQVIQTTLEKSNTDLSPQALQSFLTNAPIPRSFIEWDPTWLVGNGANQVVNWILNSNYFDPFGINLNTGGGLSTTLALPIDGFYAINVSFHLVCSLNPATGYVNVFFYDPTVGLAPQYTSWLSGPTAVATNSYQGSVTMIRPFRAGKRFAVNVGNVSGGNISLVGGSLGNYMSVAWVAPYNNYQGGQN